MHPPSLSLSLSLSLSVCVRERVCEDQLKYFPLHEYTI